MIYRLKARGRHGTHSPFIYGLIESYIYRKGKSQNKNIELIRYQLKKNNQHISITDFKTGNESQTTVSKIAKKSLTRSHFSGFLVRLIEYLQAQTILETGTSLGVNALTMASAMSVQKVYTLEGNPSVAAMARKVFSENDPDHKIELIEATLNHKFEQLVNDTKPDLLFLDADHRGKIVYDQVMLILSLDEKPKAIVIHDIYWSGDMTKHWKKLVVHPQILLTVDLYEAGIIFPLVEVRKQHFFLKYR